MKSIVVLLSLFCLCQWTKAQIVNAHGCPKDWIRHTDRCYYISPKDDTFDGANKYCQDRKAQLDPGIKCDAHMNLVEVLASYRAKCPRGQICDEFWMGIKDLTETNWRTGNNFTIERTRGCQQWADGYPRGLGTCGIVSLRGTLVRGAWKSKNCTERFKYVCISCPSNFDYVPEINECLFFNRVEANWGDAQKNCGKMKKGSHLLTIHDSAKQKAVENYMQPQFEYAMLVWIGAQRETPNVCKSPFVWKPGGAPQIPFTYTNWYPDMPICFGIQNCLIMGVSQGHSFRWRNQPCEFLLRSICEF